ncbi:sensor histidine kinase [Paenibacillus sp. GCM10027626]|uniref:cache domain-containing sensor histidine kinase n=1 Tax=Paenibacillus sp. GCM10027626 TaxID=3273411 RepID=UPI003637EEE1
MEGMNEIRRAGPKSGTIRTGIGLKVFVFYAFSIMIVILITGYLFYERSNRVIQEQLGEIALQSVQQTKHRIDSVLKEYEDRTLLILGNTDIQNAMKGRYREPFERIQSDNRIRAFLTNMIYSKKDTLNVYFLGQNGYEYRYTTERTKRTGSYESVDRSGESWYKQISEANGAPVYFGVGPSFLAGGTDEQAKRVFTFGRAIKEVEGSFQRIGVMLYEVSPDEIGGILSQMDFNGKGYAVLTGEQGQIVAGTAGDESIPFPAAKQDSTSGIRNIKVDGRASVEIFSQLEDVPWRVVGVLPLSELFKQSKTIGTYMIYLALFFIAVSLLIAYLVARYVHGPIVLLLRHMRKAQEGDFANQITAVRNDEFGLIFTGYNDMMAKIKNLIEELYLQQLIKKEMQFKVLGSQINMHFLYNSLNSIYWMSKTGKSAEISAMVRSLSDYFQLSLSEGEDEVPAREIKRLLEQYVTIQQIRYQDRFSFSIQMDETIGDFKLLKYIFQPIVENAIYHGLEKLSQPGGRLDVRFEDAGDSIVFTTIDNGVGMTKEKLAEINAILLDHHTMHPAGHFALRNIQAQLQLKYGPEYRLQLSSEEGKGTQVVINLPKITQSDNI